jgi:hypothetical protein
MVNQSEDLSKGAKMFYKTSKKMDSSCCKIFWMYINKIHTININLLTSILLKSKFIMAKWSMLYFTIGNV